MFVLGPVTVLALGFGCNTGAVAVKQCRAIELLRCEVSEACGTIDDVEECKRTYEDQCLHGIAGPKEPTADEQERCLDFIQKAGDCAEDDPAMPDVICFAKEIEARGGAGGEPPEIVVDDDAPDVCEVIAKPWDYGPCDFLNPVEGAGGEEG